MSPRVLVAAWVPGVPRTKGSLDRRMQDTPASKRWRSLLAAEFRRSWVGAGPASESPYMGPVAVRCIFVRADGVGDLDKLERNVLDALTDSGVISDDVQVVKLNSDRVERAGARRGDGAFVLVATVDEAMYPNIEESCAREIDAWVPR